MTLSERDKIYLRKLRNLICYDCTIDSFCQLPGELYGDKMYITYLYPLLPKSHIISQIMWGKKYLYLETFKEYLEDEHTDILVFPTQEHLDLFKSLIEDEK